MFAKSIFLLHVFAIACCDELTRVNIYYESLCEGCIILYPDLVPLIEKLGDYLDVHPYPFGICDMANNTKGQVTIECGHGPGEKYGNMVHGCATDALIGLPTPKGSAPLYIQFVSCVIQKKSTDEAVDECGKKLGISSEILENDIKRCAKSELGHLIHIKNAIITLRDVGGKGFRWAPTVAINGRVISIPEMEKYKNLMDMVCKNMKTPPPACKTL